VWIILAMALGLVLGRAIPSLNTHLNSVQVTSGTSLPIFIGLLVMMYPVLAKVRYDELGTVTRDRRTLVSSLVINWVIGPLVMFILAWLMLPDLPAYRTGLIIVGLARCIAMVLIWNDLACGDREAAAVLVALNSLFQVVAFALLVVLLPQGAARLARPAHRRARTIDLADRRDRRHLPRHPLVAGYLTRTIGERRRGRVWYETKLIPRIAPFALYGLLYTIVILFALQGHTITSHPTDVARIALPLLAYFAIMWFGTFAYGRAIGLPYERTATLSFTAAATTSSSPSPSPSACSASPAARRSLALSALSSRCQSWSVSSTCPLGEGSLPVEVHATHDGRSPVSDKPVVLFLCIHNSGRSLAARVLLDHYAEGRVRVESAGSEPGDQLNPSVIAILEERGLDVSKEFPKPLTDALGREADVIVTMGCGDTARSIRASVISTGSSSTLRASRSTRSAPSSTTSTDGFVRSCRVL